MMRNLFSIVSRIAVILFVFSFSAIAQTPGTIFVNSNPPGAQFYWCAGAGCSPASLWANTSNTTITGVAPGVYRMFYRLSGYQDTAIQQQTLLPGGNITFNANLISSLGGSITVNSNPPGAQFYWCTGAGCMPSNLWTTASNTTINGVAAGIYRMFYRLNGYQDSAVLEQTLTPGGNITFSASLLPGVSTLAWGGKVNLEGTWYEAALRKIPSGPGIRPTGINQALAFVIYSPRPAGGAIVHISGGRNGGVGASFTATGPARHIVNNIAALEAGINVIFAEYRGSINPGGPDYYTPPGPGSTGLFSTPLPKYGDLIPGYDTYAGSEWGHGEEEDAVAVVNWVKAGGVGPVSSTKFYVVGGSHGGYLTLAVAHKVAGITRLVSSHGGADANGFSSWYTNPPLIEYPHFPGKTPRSLMGTPAATEDYLQRIYGQAGGEAEWRNIMPACKLYQTPPLSSNILLISNIDDWIAPSFQQNDYFEKWSASYPGIKLLQYHSYEPTSPTCGVEGVHGCAWEAPITENFLIQGTIPAPYSGLVSATVIGKMLNSRTGAPVAGAKVTIYENYSGCRANLAAQSGIAKADGMVTVTNPPAGFVFVKIEAPGYHTIDTSIYVRRGINDYQASPVMLTPVSEPFPAATVLTGIFTPSAADNGDSYVFPNPAKKGQAPVFHIEASVADKVEIQIYNVIGRLIDKITLTGLPTLVTRDGKTSNAYEYEWKGKPASGVYFYTATIHNGSSKSVKKGKFAVIN